MPRILGIDTSLTATGLARIDVDKAPPHAVPTSNPFAYEIITATVGAPKPTADKSKRAMVRRVNTLIGRIEEAIDPGPTFKGIDDALPDLIAIEALAYSGTVKGESAWVLPWIWGRTLELAERYDLPLIVVTNSQIKKYATGKGNADKSTVLAATIKRYPEADVSNDNEADALTAASIGAHYLGYPLVEPTQYMAETMQKIDT